MGLERPRRRGGFGIYGFKTKLTGLDACRAKCLSELSTLAQYQKRVCTRVRARLARRLDEPIGSRERYAPAPLDQLPRFHLLA
jgi:hypothetical protein